MHKNKKSKAPIALAIVTLLSSNSCTHPFDRNSKTLVKLNRVQAREQSTLNEYLAKKSLVSKHRDWPQAFLKTSSGRSQHKQLTVTLFKHADSEATQVEAHREDSVYFLTFANKDKRSHSVIQKNGKFFPNKKNAIKAFCWSEYYLLAPELLTKRLTLNGLEVRNSARLKALTSITQIAGPFQVRGNTFPESYLTHCRLHMDKHAEQSTLRLLQYIAESMVLDLPHSPCRLKKTAEQDAKQCASWFAQIDPRLKELRQPSCAPYEHSLTHGYCRLRAKDQSPALVFRDPYNQLSLDLGSNMSIVVSQRLHATICDSRWSSIDFADETWTEPFRAMCIEKK